MVWVAALPPWLATIGRQHGKRDHLLELPLEQAEHRGCKKGGGEIDQQPVEPRARNGEHGVGEFFVAVDAAERLEVFVRLLLDHVHDVVDGDDADQAILGVEHRGRDEIVLAEHARHLLLVLQDGDATAILVGQLGKRDRAAGAEQDVERDRTLPVLVLVHDVDLVEAVGQIRRLAHVVDRLPRR
ncbi:hypothetical protein ACVWXN_002438 [Bradyrhizobium sp. i1.4.4]